MSNTTTTKYTPEALCKRITTLTERGATAESVFPKLAKETGRTVAAVRRAYYRAGGSERKHHGNRALTKEQEELMTCMLIVFSLVHKSLSNWDIISKASKIFGFDLGYLWLFNFCKRIKDELTMKKRSFYLQYNVVKTFCLMWRSLLPTCKNWQQSFL